LLQGRTNKEDAPHLVIWGTNISTNEFKEKFSNFIRTYKETNVDEDEAMVDYETTEPYYIQKLAEVCGAEIG